LVLCGRGYAVPITTVYLASVISKVPPVTYS